MHLDILKRLIGKEIDVIIDRPIGTTHPKFKDTLYSVNYGYIDSVLGGDKEFHDAYILGLGTYSLHGEECKIQLEQQ